MDSEKTGRQAFRLGYNKDNERQEHLQRKKDIYAERSKDLGGGCANINMSFDRGACSDAWGLYRKAERAMWRGIG